MSEKEVPFPVLDDGADETGQLLSVNQSGTRDGCDILSSNTRPNTVGRHSSYAMES